MLGNIALVVLACLLLQTVAAAAWALLAQRLDAARPLAQHICEFASLVVLAMGLRLLDDAGLAGLMVDAANLLLVAALLRLQRGLLLFLNLASADAEAWAVLGLSLVALLLAQLLPTPQIDRTQALLVCTAWLWVLLRTVASTWPALRTELGERWALAALWPLLAAATLLAALGLHAAVSAPPEAGAADSGFNVAVALLLLLAGVLVHVSLASLLVHRLLAELRQLSQRDPLTGLYNRAEWTEQLEAQHRWLGRYGEPFAVLMIDVDHFKAVNDSHGHAAGDAVLIALAQLLTASSRDVDVLGRFGGEEFCVLLPRTDPVSARRTAERLRQAIGDTEVAWRQQPIRLTVSIGLAMADDAEESPQQTLVRADQAMYEAKRGGRNRTVVARHVPL